MRIIDSPKYKAAFKRLSTYQQESVRLALELFQEDPNNEHLENHPLEPPMEGQWAISAGTDLRVVYRPQGWDPERIEGIELEDVQIRTEDVGRHDDVYFR